MLLAEQVLGVNFEEFGRMYPREDPSHPMSDMRIRKGPVHLEYIRAARWILESHILELGYMGAEEQTVWLKVQWPLTGTTNVVFVDLSPTVIAQGFRRVIYDQLMSLEEFRSVKDKCRPATPLRMTTDLTRVCGYIKPVILSAWIQESFGI